MDESEVHYYDLETKAQNKEWKHRGTFLSRKDKIVPSAEKVLYFLLSVF